MKKRKEVLSGKTYKILNEGCGTLYATLNKDDDELYEIMLTMGKKGNCQNTCFYIIGVLFSILFELEAPKDKVLKTIKKHLLGIRCEAGDSCFNKLADIIMKEIQNEIKEEKKVQA